MTNTEITRRYLAYKGMKRVNDHEGFQPILPVYIMDVVYEIYCKYVQSTKPRFDLKKAKNEWRDGYNAFNKEFYQAFKEEEWDEIADKLDEFRTFINNELTVAIVSVMDCFKQFDLEKQQILASLAIANILSITAQYMWGDIYKVFVRTASGFEKELPDINKQIAKIIRGIQNYTDLYYLSIGGEYVRIDATDNVVKARDVLIRKIAKYLNKK